MSTKPSQTYFDLHIKTLFSDLTILSFGGGQDSTTILFKLVLDKEFRDKYISPNGKLLVLMADTHNEHPETYNYLEDVIIPFCKEHDVEFLKIDNTMGYHGDTWQSLTGQWENNNPTIGSLAYPKTCTHNLKLQPQYRYVEQWLPKNYGRIANKTRKDNYVQFAKYYGKIRWLVGIAKGEEKRVADASKETAVWKKQAIEVQYPLIDFGLDRQACQDYIKSIGKPIPMPSNCMYCPFASNHMEILWLERYYPDNFQEWIRLEQKKLDAHKEAERNLGVSGKLHKDGDKKGEAFTLKDLLAEAKEKYGNISNEQLWEYKMSHGHCVSSSY
jgi:3'-phosphoadenosine 5'-phosphosulfate sulfotransferase (PAPS reductase)/FAD synthetase